MNVKRIAPLIALLLALAAVPALADSHEEPAIVRSYDLIVEPEDQAAFEAGMKKQVEWYEKNDETWHWHTWQWETGENMGHYVFRSPGHHLKDLDARSERGAQARAYFMKQVGSHLEAMRGSIDKVMNDLSNWPQDLGTVPMVEAIEFKVHYGMSEAFVHATTKIHKAITESGWPVHYAWLTIVSGGEVPTFWLVIPYQSYAEMEGPEKPFWAMMEEMIGRAESDALKAELTRCVRSQHSGLARFRPELSYIPAE